MPLFEVAHDKLLQHAPEQFKGLKIYERADLQRLLRDDISVIDPDLLVISEEFGDWDVEVTVVEPIEDISQMVSLSWSVGMASPSPLLGAA